MIKKLFTALYADENILYFNEGSDDAVLNCNGMDILIQKLFQYPQFAYYLYIY